MSFMERTIKLLRSFEKCMIKVPKDYDAVLRDSYGNCMKLPPKNERVSYHDYSI